MAAGTPVVASDLEAFKAVAGDAALYARRKDPRSLAAALRTALSEDNSGRIEAGRARAEGFDWGRLVGDLEEVYTEAAGH